MSKSESKIVDGSYKSFSDSSEMPSNKCNMGMMTYHAIGAYTSSPSDGLTLRSLEQESAAICSSQAELGRSVGTTVTDASTEESAAAEASVHAGGILSAGGDTNSAESILFVAFEADNSVVKSITANDAEFPIEVIMATIGGAAAPVVDIAITDCAALSKVTSPGSGDSPIETGSRMVGLSEPSTSETSRNTRKSKRSVRNKKTSSTTTAGTPRIFHHGDNSSDKRQDHLAWKSLGASGTTEMRDEYGKNVSNSLPRSNRQIRVRKQGVKPAPPSVKTGAETHKGKAKKSKNNVASFKPQRDTASENKSAEVLAAAELERNLRNAAWARAKRLKNKQHLESLEQEVKQSRQKISELKAALSRQEEEKRDMQEELQYLRSVLANQSVLSGLLKNIPNVPGVTLTSSMARWRTPGERSTGLGSSPGPRKRQRLSDGWSPVE